MSKVDIAELRRLLAEAAPGTWSWDGTSNVWVQGTCRLAARGGTAHDARFIAAAHNALPALLDELEAARWVVRQAVRFANSMSDAGIGSIALAAALVTYDAVAGRGECEL